MAREFSLVLGNQAPFGELFSFSTFYEESTNFVASEFKPIHVVCQVEVEVVLIRVGLEELTLGHQILLRLLLHMARHIALS